MYNHRCLLYNSIMKNAIPKTLPDKSPLRYMMDEFRTTPDDDIHCLYFDDYNIDMHCHDFYEINLILAGKGYHYLCESKYAVTAGDFFVVPIGMKHGYISVDGLDVLHVLVSKRFVEKNGTSLYTNKAFYSLFMLDPALKLHYNYNTQLNIGGKAADELKSYAFNIMRWENTDKPCKHTIINANALALIVLAMQCHNDSAIANGDVDTTSSAARNVIGYISEHYFEKIKIDVLAEIAGYSRSNFFKFFKKLTNMTPAEFINMYRINVAREMLSRGDGNMTEIAVACGFFDVAHFSRIFKKLVGVPPSKLTSMR